MRYLICLLALVCSLHAAAQNDETVYRLELGGGVGMGLNLTDVDGKIGLAAAAVARFPLNPRMAVKAQFSYSQIKGATDGIKNFYPIDPSQPGSDRLHYEVSDAFTTFQHSTNFISCPMDMCATTKDILVSFLISKWALD